jgi:transposase-like protein
MIKRWALSLVRFFYSLKDEDLQWQVANQEQLIKLKYRSAMAEKALEVDLKNKSVLLAHKVSLLETKNEAEFLMLKTKCKQDIKDYKQYLSSLDQLKQSIQLSYAHLPIAVAFTIHHHAKQLLNKMWEADDLEAKIHFEMQLLQFMTTVHEDACLNLEETSEQKLPQKTLNLIQSANIH